MQRTKRLLWMYRDMEWKASQAEETIRECNARMTSIHSVSDSPVVQGGGDNRREELLAECIDRKSGAEYSLKYMRMMNDALGRLDDQEKELLFAYYIDREGIRYVMRLVRLGKSRTYQLINNALAHLDRLLF